MIAKEWGPRGEFFQALDCGIVVRDFELHLRYMRSHSERYEPSYPPNYWIYITTTVRLQVWHWNNKCLPDQYHSTTIHTSIKQVSEEARSKHQAGAYKTKFRPYTTNYCYGK